MSSHGISDVVLCPGSRNAPICHTISQLEQYRCHAVTDERSAGFYAIGLALATQRTVAVCVTSGSALLNLHPAVAEAYYQQVPLLVISADRPAAWIGQMDGQTMQQPRALASVTKMDVDLPEVHTEQELWHCNRLINEAILECTHRTPGPVHINVPISEPLYQFPVSALPKARVIQRIEGIYPDQLRQLSSLLEGTQRRMIIIGQKPSDRQIAPAFMDELSRCFVSLCEHLANTGQGSTAIVVNDALMDEVEKASLAPDLVITVCGHIVNKRLKQYLRKHPPRQHWHISPDGSVADLFGCLTTVVESRPYPFLQALAYLMIHIEENNPYPTLWLDAARRAHQSLAEHAPSVSSPQGIVGRLMQMLPEDSVLHLANSSVVRYAQSYPLHHSVTVCCNRGINGIEGSVSAAVGYAIATPNRPNYLVTGDLSFLYDQNGLWNNHLPQNLHILLLNSHGGRIFNTLPVPDDPHSRSFICAYHPFSAQHLAAHYGLLYFNGASHLEEFISSKQSVLLEVEE